MNAWLSAYSSSALAGLAFIALTIASMVLMIAWWRGGLRRRNRVQRLRALAGLTLFLCFDLVVFGAYTRLTDSGLGCPDWPGCYATSNPMAAAQPIAAAEAVSPHGPVTVRKAWIEMIHRYLAMALGVLILLLLAVALRARRQLPHAWRWALLTWVWVILQGLFGALTVHWKLYPAIVTLHLLAGMGLLALLSLQRPAPTDAPARPATRRDRAALTVAALALGIQIALGGWVSTNYAVLACAGFPQCNGQWWPTMNWSEGFTLLRELGRRADGQFISMAALVAIQWAHRLFAVVTVVALGWLIVRLWRGGPQARRRALTLAALVLFQWVTGLSNVVLGWPLLAALAHTAGAAALVVYLAREAALALSHRYRILSS